MISEAGAVPTIACRGDDSHNARQGRGAAKEEMQNPMAEKKTNPKWLFFL